MLIENFSIYAINHLKLKELLFISYKISLCIIESLLLKRNTVFSFDNFRCIEFFNNSNILLSDDQFIEINKSSHSELSAALNSFVILFLDSKKSNRFGLQSDIKKSNLLQLTYIVSINRLMKIEVITHITEFNQLSIERTYDKLRHEK